MMRNRLRPLVRPVLAALMLLAGCSRGDSPPSADETNDSEYQRGLRLEKQDRPQEALAAFLKVIARRGDEDSPESHLEAGVIYLQHIKDPNEAIHHFHKYLELQPNSRQADLVRQQIDAAKREFARTLRPEPVEGVGDRLAQQEQISRLQGENDQLKADLAALRGGAPTTQLPSGPVEPAGPPAQGRLRITAAPPANDSPITLAPLNSAPVSGTPPAQGAPLKTTPRAPVTKSAPPPAAGRKHTVQAGDTLFKIAQRYYGSTGVSARIDAIYQANRDVMKSKADLKPGMELKIP
jgi:LysM repeat protein